MAKNYWVKFGFDDPRTYTGLTPTFLIFQTESGGTLPPPGITERITGTGLYQFGYDTTLSIGFLIDGGSALQTSIRYLSGGLDPVQAVDNKVGYNTDSYGSSSVDPTTIMGYAKRLQELLEGDATYNKSTGVWVEKSRAGVTTLATKTIANNATTVTKV